MASMYYFSLFVRIVLFCTFALNGFDDVQMVRRVCEVSVFGSGSTSAQLNPSRANKFPKLLPNPQNSRRIATSGLSMGYLSKMEIHLARIETNGLAKTVANTERDERYQQRK
eukprot:1566288-Amphidinium_carterae.1